MSCMNQNEASFDTTVVIRYRACPVVGDGWLFGKLQTGDRNHEEDIYA